jgi:hypothetical protein
MPRKKADLVAQAARIIKAWKSSFPTKRFSTLTVAEFEKLVQPAQQLRTELEALARRMSFLRGTRRAIDLELRPNVHRVVHAVRGDPDAGENSAMYSLMGYVTKRKRRKPGRKRAKKTGSSGRRPAKAPAA